MQDYVNASDCYEQLTQLYPDQVQYKLYYAQSLYKCGLYSEAMKISGRFIMEDFLCKKKSIK